MNKHFIALGCALWAAVACAHDELGDKIKIGLTRDAVIALIGSTPDEEGCKTYVGVSACKLVWSAGIVNRTRYEVEFIADRVVSVQVKKVKSIL